MQSTPLPSKPLLHVHVYEPSVLAHLAFTEHGLFTEHSSMSTHKQNDKSRAKLDCYYVSSDRTLTAISTDAIADVALRTSARESTIAVRALRQWRAGTSQTFVDIFTCVSSKWHRSVSAHLPVHPLGPIPLPMYPLEHEQENEPGVLSHVAWGEQAPAAHSLMSDHSVSRALVEVVLI